MSGTSCVKIKFRNGIKLKRKNPRSKKSTLGNCQYTKVCGDIQGRDHRHAGWDYRRGRIHWSRQLTGIKCFMSFLFSLWFPLWLLLERLIRDLSNIYLSNLHRLRLWDCKTLRVTLLCYVTVVINDIIIQITKPHT